LKPFFLLFPRFSFQSDDDIAKMAGPALLVVDAEPDGEPVEAHYYLVEGAGGSLDMVAGAKVNGSVVGQVIFLCRPAARNMIASATSELLSL
jgi:hypothetical protein